MGNCNHKRTIILDVINQEDSFTFRKKITNEECLACHKVIRYESRIGILSGHLYYKIKVKCDHYSFTIDLNDEKYPIAICDECNASFHCQKKEDIWIIKKK